MNERAVHLLPPVFQREQPVQQALDKGLALNRPWGTKCLFPISCQLPASNGNFHSLSELSPSQTCACTPCLGENGCRLLKHRLNCSGGGRESTLLCFQQIAIAETMMKMSLPAGSIPHWSCHCTSLRTCLVLSLLFSSGLILFLFSFFLFFFSPFFLCFQEPHRANSVLLLQFHLERE